MAQQLGKAAPPQYTPFSDQMLDPRWWRKRVTLIVALTSLLSGTVAALGGRVVWPGENVREVTRRVAKLERQDSARLAVLDSLRREVRASTYVGCQTLRLVQPAGAVLPEVCQP